jgi:hypothetical protein
MFYRKVIAQGGLAEVSTPLLTNEFDGVVPFAPVAVG